MASSRDVLNAFIAHVDGLVALGRMDEAAAAWRDFLDNVAPSFGPEHRREARARYDAFVGAAGRGVAPANEP